VFLPSKRFFFFFIISCLAFSYLNQNCCFAVVHKKESIIEKIRRLVFMRYVFCSKNLRNTKIRRSNFIKLENEINEVLIRENLFLVIGKGLLYDNKLSDDQFCNLLLNNEQVSRFLEFYETIYPRDSRQIRKRFRKKSRIIKSRIIKVRMYNNYLFEIISERILHIIQEIDEEESDYNYYVEVSSDEDSDEEEHTIRRPAGIGFVRSVSREVQVNMDEIKGAYENEVDKRIVEVEENPIFDIDWKNFFKKLIVFSIENIMRIGKYFPQI